MTEPKAADEGDTSETETIWNNGYARNVANHGRGSEMTAILHSACDDIELLSKKLTAALAENEALRVRVDTAEYLVDAVINDLTIRAKILSGQTGLAEDADLQLSNGRQYVLSERGQS